MTSREATGAHAPDAAAVRITDSTLRDGSHAMAHRFSAEQVRATVAALDDAGVPVLEVSHGDGLGGSSFNYGFSATGELDLVAVAAQTARRARIAVLLLPGVGTVEDLERAADAGASIARIATHCTEADIAVQHFGLAREIGLETVGFLMLSHMLDAERLAKQGRIMVDAGAQCVYVVDSAGALVLEEASDRVGALVEEIGSEAQVGFHGHNNLGLGVANSIRAYQAGARQLDGATCSLGAGSGNSATEVLAAVFDRLGVPTGIDLPKVLAAAEEVVRPYMEREPITDRNAIVMGHTGVYSSFLLHAERAARRYDVPAYELLSEAGRRRYVGGQEDMLIDIAIELAGRRKSDEAATSGGAE
jgi:4-hydroxy 2-oxovalerate aldolase